MILCVVCGVQTAKVLYSNKWKGVFHHDCGPILTERRKLTITWLARHPREQWEVSICVPVLLRGIVWTSYISDILSSQYTKRRQLLWSTCSALQCCCSNQRLASLTHIICVSWKSSIKNKCVLETCNVCAEPFVSLILSCWTHSLFPLGMLLCWMALWNSLKPF